MKPKFLQSVASSAFVTLATAVVFTNQVSAAVVTSVASGAWNLATSWSDGLLPAVGNDYVIDGESVSSPNATNNQTLTFAGGKMEVSSGELQLKVEHNDSRTATFSIANCKMSGGTLVFDSSNGNSTWNFDSPIDFGTGTNSKLVIRDGNFTTSANLKKAITGSGNIAFEANRSDSSDDRAYLFVQSANSTFSGNWTAQGFDTGAFANIRAAAANALGTGTVTLLDRGALIVDTANGINSLAGITLSHSAARLNLNNFTWTNAGTPLTVNGGTVNFGTATAAGSASIASLSGTGGVITTITPTSGTPASSLTLNQTVDASFAGTIAPVASTSLSLMKNGASSLTLSNATPFSGTVPLLLNNGTLAFGNGVTTLATANVSSLAHAGGNLHLDLSSSSSDLLNIAGNYTHTAGGIVVAVSGAPALGTPYALVNYGGTLSGTPTVSFQGLTGTRYSGTAQYGDGSADAITVSFSGGAASLVWSGNIDNAWDLDNTANWLNGITPDKFLTYDNVIFNDNATSGNLSPNLASTITAGDVTFDNSANSYTLTGVGGIGGSGTLTKSNIGTATIATNNSYSGGTEVLGGKLVVGNAGTTGTLGSGPVFIDTGATLSFNRTNTFTPAASTLSGTGTLEQSGSGTLALTAAQGFNGLLVGSAGIIQVSDGLTNTPGAGVSSAASITMKSGSILDLPRLHATGGETPIWSLPPLALQSGSSLRFRASTGSTFHNTAANIGVTGSVIIENSGGGYDHDITLSGIVSGSGTINFKSANAASGTYTRSLTLSSTGTSYSGNWFVQHANSGDDFGQLVSTAAGALGTGTVTLDTRAQLASSTANGLDSISAVTLAQSTSSAFFNSGWSNPAGVLTLTNGTVTVGTATSLSSINIASLAQSAGAIQLDLGSNAASNDKITVSGNADLAGGQILFNPLVNPDDLVFDILVYGGTLTGVPNVTGDAGRLVPTVSAGTGINDKVTLGFTGDVASLVWKGNDGTNPNTWDNNVTTNWDNAGSPDKFLTFDNVTFNDTAASFTPSITGSLKTGAVVFNNSANAYTLSGTGAIDGVVTLTKNGTNSATISNANTFTGNVTVNAGKLLLGNVAALGNSAAGVKNVTVNSGGQLDFNGISPGTSRGYTYRIAGTGDGTGSLVNSSATSVGANSGIYNLELTDDASIGGTSRIDIARLGTVSGTITGNNHTLTKVGTNQVQLRGAATGLSILVQSGTLGIEDHNDAFGGASGAVTVANGATVTSWGARTIATPITLNAGAILSNLGGGTPTWTGAITLGGDAVINPNGQTLNVDGIVSGTGFGLTVPSNGGTLNLNGVNTFTGGLVIGATAATITTVNIGAASSLGVSSGEQVVIGNTAAVGTVNQTLGVSGSVTNSGTLRIARMGIVNLNSGGSWVQSGGATVEGVGGYNATMNVNSNATFTYNGTGSVKLNGAVGNSGQALLSIAGTLATSAGFEQTTAPTTGFGRVTLSGTLELGANVPQLTTAVQFYVSGTNGTIDTKAYDATLSADIAGVATGAALAKSGTGKLTLTGTNTYTGDTWLDEGTLAGKGNPSSKLTAASGTTLGPGASIGTFSCAGADLTAGGTLAIEIDSTADTADKLVATAAVDITGASISFTEVGSGTIPADTELVILDYTGTTLTGTFSGYAEGASINLGANTFTLSYADSSRVTLTSTTAGSPYTTWASSKGLDGTPGKDPAFDADPEGDGYANGLEWILGGDPLGQDAASLVTTTASEAGGLTLSFDREEDSIGQATLTVEYDTNLADAWTSFATVGPTGSGPVTINTATDPDEVSVNIPASNAAAGKLFGRLKAVQP
jgi:autotransporter-associated beta strand protein